MKEVSEELKAYLAGIVDGEGGIGSARPNPGIPSLYVSVSMTDARVPKLLHEVFGGTLHKFQTATTNKDYWQWRVHGAACKEVLESIQPYSIVKAMHVKVGLKFVETIKEDKKRLSDEEYERKLELHIQLRLLNRKVMNE